MTNVDDILEMAWLVACLSPADIAPHPNFRADNAMGPELLALLAQFKWDEFQAYVDEDLEADRAVPTRAGATLLKAARAALDSETIMSGLNDLLEISDDERLSFGQRSAALLIAASVASEIDKPEATIEGLFNLATRVQESRARSSASRKLMAGVLYQQSALRSLEAGLLDQARQHAKRAVQILSDTDDSWESFPMSRGVNWSASDSQSRLVEAVSTSARSLLISTSSSLDSSWTEIVRAPFPLAKVRPVRDTLNALTSVVTESFEHSYDSISRSNWTTGKSETTFRALYASLLNAEMTGDVGDVASLRQTFGDVLALSLLSDTNRISILKESIRLLRQGDSEKHLRRLLHTMRMRGPLETLREIAERLIETRETQSFITSSDLALLDRSADLISSAHADKAVGIVMRYARQTRDGRVKGRRVVEWKRLEMSLKSMRAILQGNEGVNTEAAVLSIVNLSQIEKGHADQFVFSTLAQLSTQIRWTEVSDIVRNQWFSWIESVGASPHALIIDRLRAANAISKSDVSSLRDGLDGLEFAAALVNQLLGDRPAEADLAKAVRTISITLAAIRSDAASGKFTGYFWSPFAIAAYLVTEFDRVELWPALLEALTDPRVAYDGKAEALEILASSAPRADLPEELRQSLQSQPIPIATKEKFNIFSVPVEQLNCARRNFYLAFGLESDEDVQTEILRSSVSPDAKVRSAAAESCLLIAMREPASEWPQILLLQLSFDDDPSVRNSVSRALGYLSFLPRVLLLKKVRGRVSTLLHDSGIAIPMGVLQGLSDAGRHWPDSTIGGLWCVDLLTILAATHPSQNVRRSARVVLELFKSA